MYLERLYELISCSYKQIDYYYFKFILIILICLGFSLIFFSMNIAKYAQNDMLMRIDTMNGLVSYQVKLPRG